MDILGPTLFHTGVPWETAEARTAQEVGLAQRLLCHRFNFTLGVSVSLREMILHDSAMSMQTQGLSEFTGLQLLKQTPPSPDAVPWEMAVVEVRPEIQVHRGHPVSFRPATAGRGTSRVVNTYVTTHQSHASETWAHGSHMHRTQTAWADCRLVFQGTRNRPNISGG